MIFIVRCQDSNLAMQSATKYLHSLTTANTKAGVSYRTINRECTTKLKTIHTMIICYYQESVYDITYRLLLVLGPSVTALVPRVSREMQQYITKLPQEAS